MSGRWFRVYEELLTDPKVQRLPPDLFKFLINLWCIASKHGGVLPCVEDVSRYVGVQVIYTSRRMSTLTSLGFLEVFDGKIRPHNWHKRQYKSDTYDRTHAERQKRYRDGKRNRHAYDQKQSTEVEKGRIPLGNSSRSLPAERVTRDAAEATASGGSLGGSPPAVAAERRQQIPQFETPEQLRERALNGQGRPH